MTITNTQLISRLACFSSRALLLLLSTGCAPDEIRPATQVIVLVNSDLQIGAQLTRVKVAVQDEKGLEDPIDERSFRISSGMLQAGQVPLPFSFSIVPSPKRAADRFRLVVTGYGPLGPKRSEQEVVRQKVIASFQTGQTVGLAVYLGEVCFQKLCAGDPDETCYPSDTSMVMAGTCAEIVVQDDLPKVEPGKEQEDTTWPKGTEDAGNASGNMDGGVDSIRCRPASTRCEAGKLLRCNTQGNAEQAETCLGDGVCTEGACPPGQNRCVTLPVTEPGITCSLGDASGVCVDGSCMPVDSTADAGTDSGAPDGGPKGCVPMCTGLTPVCRDGTCAPPTSCVGLAETCGASGASRCCEPLATSGGSFLRSYDAVTAKDSANPATLTPFALDKLEVTVGRFRRFVQAGQGTQQATPAAGAGSVGDLQNSGWSTSFDTQLMSDKASLVSALKCNASFQTWTDTEGAGENRPINCVTWYEAQAFCIWDGGRLPTEAEWNFAAAGGDEQRVYPWSIPATSTAIDPQQTSYYADNTKQCYGDGVNGCSAADIVVCGSKAGQGRWGHYDLAGNLSEWVLDYFASTYVQTCVDCVQLDPSTERVTRGGGFASTALSIGAAFRSSSDPLTRSGDVGFRCVYRR